MLSSCVSKLARGRTATTAVKIATRNISQLGDAKIETANCAWSKSCYSGIDYTIDQNSPVIDAVEKFAAYNVGALVTTDEDGKSFLAINNHLIFLSYAQDFENLLI